MGVQTVKLTEARGKLAGARVVRDGYQVMLISTGGTVIRIPVEEFKRLGRSTQGVIVMRLRGEDERVSALAPVVESSAEGENGDAADVPEAGDDAGRAQTPMADSDEPIGG
jgi:DNA gyrase subunit A